MQTKKPIIIKVAKLARSYPHLSRCLKYIKNISIEKLAPEKKKKKVQK